MIHLPIFTTRDQFLRDWRPSPVDSLPNELLSYIFTLGSGAEEQGDHDNDNDTEEGDDSDDDHRIHLPFKVLVSHVCRRWHTVAVETPTLWTRLDFAEGPPFHKSRTWLERSKSCPLDIELDLTFDEDTRSDESDDQADASSNDDDLLAPRDRVAMPGGPAPPPKDVEPRFQGRVSPLDLPAVRDLILPHAARWRIFELMVSDFQIMYGILSTLAPIPSAPQLQALRLYHYDDDEDYDHFSPAHLKQPFAPFCGRAPSLMQAALWGVHVDWETCVFLQGLEELELAYHAKDVRPPYNIFTRILQGSPDLHILTLCASGPAGNPEDWPTDVIELPSVKHLVLAFIEPSYVSALMKRLVFPNLSSLALDFDPEDYSSFLEQLAKPAPNHHHHHHHHHHSLCQNLIDLKISGMQCSNAALDTFFSALPNLASLNLNCYHLPRHFFDCLYPIRPKKARADHKDHNDNDNNHNNNDDNDDDNDSRPDECYLPKLDTLTTSGITGEEMRDLLTCRTVPPIKHVLMDSGADVADKEEEWLRAHVETFDFFECSDDEDDPTFTELDDEDEDEGQVVEGEADGVPGQWIDHYDPME
jgi:F-box-like